MKTRKLNVVAAPVQQPKVEKPRLAKLTERLEERMVRSSRKMESFISNFNTNPAYAFEWSKDAFEHAAWQAVAAELLAGIQNMKESTLNYDDEIYDTMMGHAKKMCLQMARYPSQSTSPTSNLIEQYKLAAWATIADETSFW